MKTPRLLALVVFAALAATAASPARAQDDGTLDRSRMATAAFYHYAEPGEITVNAQVLGTVRFPGRYEVARGTRFSDLMALSGGPQMAERYRRDKRTIVVQLYRLRGEERVLIKESEASRGLDVKGGDPQIQDGDVIVVETIVRQGMSWRDIFPVVGALASVTLIVDRFTQK